MGILRLENQFGISPSLAGLSALMGPGGSAGEINYPPHMLGVQQALLYGTHGTDQENAADTGTYPAEIGEGAYYIAQDIATARSDGNGSPFANVAAHNPQPELDELDAKVSDACSVVTAIDPQLDIPEIYDIVKSMIDDAFEDPFDPSTITNLVNAFDDETKTDFLQVSSRILSGHFDVRSIVATGSSMAIAIGEDARLKAVQTFRREQELERDRQRFQHKLLNQSNTMTAVTETVRLMTLQAGSLINLANLQDQASRTKIVAKTDQLSQDIGFEQADALWDLELYKHANAMTASIAGAATMPRGLSENERAIGAVATIGSLIISAIVPFF